MAPVELDEFYISDWVYTNYIPVAVIIPGREAPTIAMRRALILGSVTVFAFALAVVVVYRRRPY